jgi:hypothetical protein
VIDIDDSTASNFFAFSAGIIPSKSFSSHALRLQPRADLVAEVDVEADELAVRRLRFERRVAGIGTEPQRGPVLRGGGAGRYREQGDRNGGNQSLHGGSLAWSIRFRGGAVGAWPHRMPPHCPPTH